MPTQTNQRKPVKKKKKRLRKPIRIALYCIGALIAVLLIWKIAGAFTAKPDTETVESDPKQTETDQNSTTDTENKNSEESTDDLVKTSSGLELKKYPDTGETVATILIDPGHGGYDPGNMSDPTDENSIKEKDINLAVAQKVIARLNEINPQIKIYYTRIDDTVSWASEEIGDLTGRVEMQKNSNADLFLSIHCNAYPDNSEISGYEYYIKPNDPVMSAITEAITRNLEQTGYSEYKGTLLTDQYVLQVITDAQIPAALMEIGYMTNPEELNDLTNPDVQQKIADSIAGAISDYIMNHQDEVAGWKSMFPAENAE